MRKFRFIVTMAIVVAFSVTLALLSRKLFMDKAEDKKLKDLITTEETRDTGQSITGSSEFKRNADYLNELSQQNSDCIGWLKVSGCDIDYPVMYCKEDPEFYLHANFDKEYSGIGTPYVDGFCTPLGDKRSDNVIIYGHNISSGEMFHYLNRYEDEEFYQKHKYIQYDTLDGPGEYEVIAAFRYVAWSDDDGNYKYQSSSLTLYKVGWRDLDDFYDSVGVSAEDVSGGKTQVISQEAGIFVEGDSIKINTHILYKTLQIYGKYEASVKNI